MPSSTIKFQILRSNIIHILKEQAMQNQQPLILIYYHFKGMAQVARHLICFLGLTVIDIHLDLYEQQKQKLPLNIINTLQTVRIDRSQLPILIHEDLIICQLYPIMAYLCRRFKCEDLLGVSLQQKARVQQLIQIYIACLPHTQSILFALADLAAQTSQNQLLPIVDQYYRRVLKQSGYMRQLSQLLILQDNPRFLLGNITILDFYFLESSNYMLGQFGSLDPNIANERWREKAMNYGGKMRGLNYLRAMFNYQHRLKNMNFYLTNKSYLQSYSVIGTLMSSIRAKGMRKLWAIQMKEVV